MSFSLDNRQIIISYHYVCAPTTGIYPCPPAEFERQVKFLTTNYRSTSLEEVWAAARAGSGERLCAITFDDGTKDHFTNAAPILRQHHASATFFPIAGVFDGLLPFVHRVHILLAHFDIVDLIDRFNTLLTEAVIQPTTLFIPKDRRRSETTRNDYGGDFRVDNFKETMALAPVAIRERFMAERLAQLDLSLEDLRTRLFMTEDELDALDQQGFSIGNHTYNHVALDQLDEPAMAQELHLATERLLKILRKTPVCFSYPWGRSGRLAPVVLNRLGFKAAVTIERRGVASSDSQFLLPRYDANDLRNFLNERP